MGMCMAVVVEYSPESLACVPQHIAGRKAVAAVHDDGCNSNSKYPNSVDSLGKGTARGLACVYAG